MNCCDYDCNQGRDCPARKPATVARVGQRIHGPEPLRESPWRRRLHSLAELVLMAIIALLMWAAIGLVVVYA